MDRRERRITSADVKLVALFALAGPPIGTILLVIGITLIMLPSPSGGISMDSVIGGMAVMLIFGLVAGFILGVVPAALTGVACAFLSRRVTHTALSRNWRPR